VGRACDARSRLAVRLRGGADQPVTGTIIEFYTQLEINKGGKLDDRLKEHVPGPGCGGAAEPPRSGGRGAAGRGGMMDRGPASTPPHRGPSRSPAPGGAARAARGRGPPRAP